MLGLLGSMISLLPEMAVALALGLPGWRIQGLMVDLYTE